MAEPGDESLATSYDLLMFDLDGVVYSTAGRWIMRRRASRAHGEAGARIAFITNNASRTPEQVAEHLRELGVGADAGRRGDLLTGGGAGAARPLRRRARAVAVLGADGLLAAVREAGLEPVAGRRRRAVAIVSGYAPEVRWQAIMRAAVRSATGCRGSPRTPTRRCPPETGRARARHAGGMISDFAGVAAGGRQAAAAAARRDAAPGARRRPLMVGDGSTPTSRARTAAGTDSLLVMTGVTASRRPGRRAARPTAHLGRARPDRARPRRDAPLAARWRVGARTAGPSVADGRLVVDGAGDPDGWWTVVAAAGWATSTRPATRPTCRA